MNFRKGPDSLAALVYAEYGGDPFAGVIYVFRAKRGDRVKLIWWDGTGLCLMAKKLAALDNPSRCRRLDDRAFAGAEAVAWSTRHQDTKGGGHDVEALGNVLADRVQCTAAATTGLVLDIDNLLDALKMGRERAVIGLARLDRTLEELRRSERLFADERTAPVLDPGRGCTKTGQL